MAPISLRIVMDDGVVTRTVKFDSTTKVSEAHAIVDEKMMTAGTAKEYRLFLTSAENERTGIWLEDDKNLDFYMLRDGDSLHFLCKTQSLRVKMLDGSVKTILVDKAMPVGELMQVICHKIGLANHDEYGLCYDEPNEPEEMNPAMGTLTMKRKPQHREKDAKMEHLSKKLKTDDNVQWLDQHKSLRELNVDPADTLLLKRRLFYSDRKVDARDPVQLNLLYVQARDAILDGRHPVTSDKAVEFAGLQCQVQFGDYQEDKHKPGIIEKLKEFLPEQYAGSRSIEKKIIKEFQKHQGLGEVDAKNLYTKTARDLPTYGVTFFLVKEKPKGVKKLVPRLLGISCESILRLDEVTKEILQTWPLTQVKTFQVGKTETFTLNFGDYSDKEYTVKTNEGFRIRDILQGYIDLIGRRMHAGPFNTAAPTGGQLLQDHVEAGRVHLMEHVTQTPMAVVEQSYVGPSKIISYEPGQATTQGTQIVTVQQLVIADKTGTQQRAVTGGVPMRNDMSKTFVKKLNSLNSNSVKIVTFLTDPTEQNIEQTKKTVTAMEEVMPDIIKGVKETAEKQSSEDARNLLLSQLQELDEFLASLCYHARADPFNTIEVEDAAKKTADLSTQIYFALDARTRRRSNFVERSRQSFIADEATRASLHRASFIATSATTCHGINNCLEAIEKEYAGPALDYSQVNDLEKETVDRMGKLNAAIALLLDAHADPKHIDYTSALNSLNTINEMLPELANNVKALGSVKDEKSRAALLDELRELCEAARNVCMSTGSEDLSKLQEAANSYADVSGKLIYKFGRGVDPDKENEIIDLAREVGNKTSIMLVAANELATMSEFGPAANDVDAAGVRCADAARALLAAAQLTAPSIREPRCQSALTAAAENLSSSAQHLATTWRPLVEQPGQQKIGEELRSYSLELSRALDRLKDAYADLNDKMDTDEEEGPASKNVQRLKFITTMSGTKKHIQDAERQLLQPISKDPIAEDEILTAQKNYTKNMGNLNASIAALLAAMANRENRDYGSADSALNTIAQLMLKIVKDTRALSRANDAEARQKELQELFDAVTRLCAYIEAEDSEKLPEAVSEYAKLSNKLIFTRGMGTSHQKEQQIIILTNEVRDKTSALLEEAKKLAKTAKCNPAAVEVEKARGNCIDATNILLTTAQLTTPSIEERRCLTALTAATENLASSAQHLTVTCKPLMEKPEYQQTGQHLQVCSKDLASALDNLRHAFNNMDNDEIPQEDEMRRDGEKQRLLFKGHASEAENLLQTMEKQLNEPFTEPMEQQNLSALHQKYSDSMARLNAAIAGLIAAKSRQDFIAAKLALDDVKNIMPEVVTDAKALGCRKNDRDKIKFLDSMKVLCETVRHLSTTSDDPKDIQATANAFTETSRKLLFTFGRGVEPSTENEVVQLAQAVSDRTAELVGTVKDLTTTLPSDILNDGIKAAGVNCTNDAQVLLATAKVTAPSIQEPQCQKALTTASQTLSLSVQHLASICRLPIEHPNRFHLGEKLQTNCFNIAEALDKLKKSYSNLSNKKVPKVSADKEKQRLKFVTTLANADDNILAAQKQLDKPVKSNLMKDDKIKANQHKFSNSLNHMNAAIASLVATTTDIENPDYKAAESAINTITQLMPKTIEDSRALSSTLDEKSKESLLEDTKSLCNAARKLCACINSDDPEKIQDAANTYANASRKLIYRVERGVQDKENEVIDLAQDVGQKTSQLLVAANELVVAAETEPNVNEVDVAGVSCADAARALLSTAQVTSPSIHEPLCQQALTSSANMLSSKVKKLSDAWEPLTEHPARKHLGENLKRHDEELSKAIEKLKNLFRNLESPSDAVRGKIRTPKIEDQHHIKFISTIAAAENSLKDAENRLNQPVVASPMKQENINELQNKFGQNLGILNASTAALISATTHRDKQDYNTAEFAVNTITQLMPKIIDDSKLLSSTVDEVSKQALLDEMRALCDSMRTICTTSPKDPEKLQVAANKYADVSEKLIYMVGRGVLPEKGNEIIELAKEVAAKTSGLLLAANDLTSAVPKSAATKLDATGADCADAARSLLVAAQVTASTINEQQCKNALNIAVENLSASTQHLAATWKPLVQQSSCHKLGENLQLRSLDLAKSLDNLKNAYSDIGEKYHVQTKEIGGLKGKQGTDFATKMISAENQIRSAEKHLDEPLTKTLLKEHETVPLQAKYLKEMSDLNAAITALVASTADQGKPNHASAELAVNTIRQLIPEIVKDTKSLSSTLDDKSRQKILQETRALCNSAGDLCALTASENYEKIPEASKSYYNASEKLVFKLGRRKSEKSNEVSPHSERLAAIKASIAEHPWRHQSDKLAGPGTKSKQEEKQHVELINQLESAESAVQAVEKLLNVPLTVPPGGSRDSTTLQRDLSQNMGRLNAALAALIAAISNCEKPKYGAAEKALKTISETLPAVAKDTRILTDGHDEKTHNATVNQLKNMSEAIRGVCASARHQQTEDMCEFVSEFSTASGKLFFIVSPSVDQQMENQIMMMTMSSCERVSQLLSNVHQLAKAVGEADGIKLDKIGSKVADAAQTLIITSQITAPCISEPQCQSALLSSVDALSSTIHDLSSTWKPLTVSKHKPVGEALERDRQALEEELLKLKNACQDELHLRQNIRTTSKKAPPVPIRRVSLLKSDDKTIAKDQTQKNQENTEEFLEHLRQEEIHRQMAEEQILKTQFAKFIEDANKHIVSTENDFRKVLESKTPITTNIPLEDLQKKMELEIAKSAVAAASLVAANHPDKLDYNTATASVNDIKRTVAQILEYAKPLSSSLDESSRKLVIEDTLNLSQAARKVCETANTDRKKLSEAAVTFGEKYSKLLYAVSEDVNPSQEKEVLARAREIGESASRVALEGAELASSTTGDLSRKLCSAGRSCADAAVSLFYTTKLLSATIQVPENQIVLTAASKHLSAQVDAYTAACKPLGADPKHATSFKKLNSEADQLHKLLDNFRQDLEAGKLVKQRERLVIEDTPLRQLARKILEIAKKKAEKSVASAGENHESAYAEYAKKLADAIRLVDLANARCKRSPHDARKRLELEDVIQSLQQTLLLARPHHGAKNKNIVDLADFVKDVSAKAEQLIDSANKTRSSGPKKPLESIINECHKINLNEFKLLKPQGGNKDISTFENILEVEYFGQDCDSRLSKINSNIKNFDDDLKRVVQDKANTLDESCDYLRFATKSALATALSAAFDKALYDLTDIEKKMDKMLIPHDGDRPSANRGSSSLLMSRAKLLTAVAEAARPSGAPRIASAFTRYVAEMRARTDLNKPADKDRLTEHLKKLLHLLKTITVSTSRRVATWQPVDEAEVAAIAEEIIQELETPLDKPDAKSDPGKTPILASKDISRLLLPFDQVKVEGDKAKLEDKLQHVATKLNTVAGTVLQSVHSPQSLTRSAHAAVDAALELAAVTRALDKTEPLKNTKVEEAVQEMSFATFSLLKTAESASQEPNDKNNRRRLLEACRLLNDSINKLGRAPASSNKLRRECDESIRSLQYGLQLGALKDTSTAVAASSYTDCLEALAKQRDVLQELNNDKQMSKEEFSKSLSAVTSAISSSTEYAAQCAYLLSVSEQHKDLAEAGIVDVTQIKKATAAIQDTCSAVFVHSNIDKAKEVGKKLTTLVQDLHEVAQKTSEKIKNPVLSSMLSESVNKVDSAVVVLNKVLSEDNAKEDKITPATMSVLDAINTVNVVSEHPSLTPEVGKISAETQARIDEVTNCSKNLSSNVLTMIREVKTVDDEDETMTWVMFNTNRTGVLDAFEKLMNSIRANGQKAGLIQQADVVDEDSDSANKSYLEIQLDQANKWLKRPTAKPDVKSAGEKAASSILELGETIAEELKGSDKDEMHHLTNEIKQLLDQCIQKYDSQKASVLMERLKETKKAIERCVVTRVVEDFIEEETPLQDLEIFVDAEKDETKRKFLLEKKIAELLAHLGKVTKTARIVSDTRKGDHELRKCSNQAELLAPILVKAAEERVNSPNNQAAKEKYKSVLAEYAESLSKVREMCDRAVDPMEFVQTAGETMQRMREESSQHNDPQKCAFTSVAITKLANRVIHVGMSSDTAKRDPELQRALTAARERLTAVTPAADTRASRMPDFNTTTAEILRTAGEVEFALGGENIFNKQPEPNQPIYNAALNLHATLREWSARDNDIVAVAKRMAVQMAKLSDFMYADKKRDVLLTSKEIVKGAHEVAELAKKLALECTDLRIRKDLFLVCETIPTISGQLKMLTSIKGSSLGHQGTEEDKEAMNMLIGNAQNLMICIQDVVKSAAAASVKIRSQRGGTRIRWVRKNYLL